MTLFSGAMFYLRQRINPSIAFHKCISEKDSYSLMSESYSHKNIMLDRRCRYYI